MRRKLTAVSVAAAVATAFASVIAVAAAGSAPASMGSIPPGAGYAQAFAFDPRRPEIVYVATVSYPHDTTRAHVFKTTDGGRHWHATATRGPGWTGDVVTLAADPQHPGTLYAGTNVAVYKTVNGGRSWRPWNRGLFPPPGPNRPYGTPGSPSFNRGNGWVTDIAVDPADSDIVYANAGGIRKSTDGGHSWRTVFWRRHVGISAPVIAPTSPQTVSAAAFRVGNWSDPNPLAAWLYKSADGGKTWRATAGFTVANQAGYPTTLALDPQVPTTLYLAAGSTVLRSTDAGTSWQSIAGGLPAEREVSSLAVDPRQSGTVYVGLRGYVIPGPGPVAQLQHSVEGIFKTTDGGLTWSKVSSAAAATIAVDPARPATIYAGVDQPGHRIIKSTDGGLTWASAG
jgi:photosystem II stability/assembly factor-like uncharacterized protein